MGISPLVDIWTTKINGKHICAWSFSLSRTFFLTVLLHSPPLAFFSTFVAGRKGWDLCCGRWCQGNSCYPQYLFSPLHLQTHSDQYLKSWNLNNKCIKIKLEVTSSKVVEPGNDYHTHLSLAPLTRKHCRSFIPPIQFSSLAFER